MNNQPNSSEFVTRKEVEVMINNHKQNERELCDEKHKAVDGYTKKVDKIYTIAIGSLCSAVLTLIGITISLFKG